MQYKVIKESGIQVTKTGKSYNKLTLVLPSGEKTDNVSIWQDFPNFQDVTIGSKIDGNLHTNDKGYVTLYPPKTTTGGAYRASGAKQEVIAKAVERKEESIQKFQETKEESIRKAQESKHLSEKLYLTMEAAKDFTRARLPKDATTEQIKQETLKWREWFWNNWEYPQAEKLTSNGDMTPFEKSELPETVLDVWGVDEINPDEIPF